MHDLYEPKLYCSIFLDDAQDKIYAEVSPTLKRYETDKVKVIPSYDLSTDPKTIDLLIKVTGYEETPLVTDDLSPQTVKIIDPSVATTVAEVRDEIDTKVYNVTARVYKNGQLAKSGAGTITKNSDIEIL